MRAKGYSFRTDLMILDYQEGTSSGGVHHCDARLKLVLLASVVALNIGFAQLWLSFSLLLAGAMLVLWARVPLRLFAIFFLAPAWATLIVFLGFSIGFGTTPFTKIGPLTLYREGMWHGLSAAVRVATDMSWMALVFLTTPMPRMLAALRSLRIPEVLVDSIAMAFRYAFLLFDQFHRMLAAARARGGLQNYRVKLESIGSIVARILLRAYDRATAIQAAMVARGGQAPKADGGPPSESRSAVGGSMETPDPQTSGKSTPFLAARGLSFSYLRDGPSVISELNFKVEYGEIVVLCGPNGCGKSTLLKLFAGILSSSEGEIRLQGRLLDRRLRNEAFRYVGLLFQDADDQLFCTHVREDVGFGPTNMGLDPVVKERLVSEAMELTEVAHLGARPTHRLSYGEMKRVGLAGLIAMGPPLLLLDEPSAYLDPAATAQFVNIVRKLHADHGYSFVIVTHDMDLAASLATRIVILQDGRIIADNSPREILTDHKLLKRARLEAPLLTRLFGSVAQRPLSRQSIPLNVDEARLLLQEWSTESRQQTETE
jgi:cobalt ECF transporter T component CbiQ